MGRAAGVRGAEPPAGGGPVEFGDFLAGAVAVLEVIQLRAVVYDVAVDIALRITNLAVGQQEDFAGKSISPAVDGLAGAASRSVWNFDLLDLRLDIRVEPGKEGAVQVRLDGAVGVVVDVGAVPLTGFKDVLAQQPGPVAGGVVKAGGLALVDDDVIHQRPVFFQLDNTAYRFRAELYSCHCVSSLWI